MEKLCKFPLLCLVSTTYVYRTPQALHADTLALFLETIGSKLTWAEAYV